MSEPSAFDATLTAESASSSPQVGAASKRQIGRYVLGAKLGEGGMGVVYSAERTDAYEQRVAVKVMRFGVDERALARFRDERQILATLSHPCIVRQLDGGSTADNLPYLVMELVEGERITTYAAGRPMRDRIALFRKVCDAVQYAHVRLVVHRDLKPSNILVDAAGEPKLLDFGIAVFLDPERTREAETSTHERMLTPQYASPEQARGERITVATDVYALGAVLYELLTGRPAIVFENPHDYVREISEVDPVRPEIDRDLDSIVLKALSKDPADRYQSVEQLSADLQHYLGGAPVRARDATWRYRTGKYVRRHLGKFALATLVFVALGTAAAISIAQARRAEAEATSARRTAVNARTLASSLILEFDESLRNVAGATSTRELMVRRALASLDALATEASSDLDLEQELAVAYLKVADIQGNHLEASLNRPLDALITIRKSAQLAAKLRVALPADPKVQRLHRDVAILTSIIEVGAGRFDDAERHLALLPAELLTTGSRAYDRYAFQGYIAAISLAQHRGDLPGMRRLLEQLATIIATWDASMESRYARAGVMAMRASLALAVGDIAHGCDEAVRHDRETRALLAEFPTDSRFAREVAFSGLVLGGCRTGIGNIDTWAANTGELEAGEAAVRAALIPMEQLASDAVDARSVLLLTTMLTQLAGIVTLQGGEAGELADRAITMYEAIPYEQQVQDIYRWWPYCLAAPAYARAGRHADAIRRGLAGLAFAIGQHVATPNAESLANLAMCHHQVAITFEVLGAKDAALVHVDRTIAKLDELHAMRQGISSDVSGFVEVVVQRGRLAEPRCDLAAEVDARISKLSAADAMFIARHREKFATLDCR